MAADLREQFDALDPLMVRTSPLWRLRPFHQKTAPWAGDHPGLERFLASLSLADIECLEQEPDALRSAVARYVPAIGRMEPLLAFPATPLQPLSLERHFHHGIPGRKWQQIQAFQAAVPSGDTPLLEWCAGKGHLGRTLAARDGRVVTGLEWDPTLCRAANSLAARQRCDQRMVEQDVMEPEAAAYVRSRTHVIALHACGDLHRKLLEDTVKRRPLALTLSPCCYQRTHDDRYPPYSQRAAQSALQLTRDNLRLAVQESVTAGQRTRRLRDRETAWRLGFDRLQRHLRGVDDYLPVPSVPGHVIGEDFAVFCAWAAQAREVALPAGIDWLSWEKTGWAQLPIVRREELVTHAFRRPLETWLVLDRALFLEEAGYRVTIQTFCERSLTPRNLLIRAVRR